MNSFEKKKISIDTLTKGKTLKHHLFAALGVLFILFFLYQAGAQVIDGISSTNIVRFVTSFFGKELLIDKQRHTNILLLGVGGENHDGGTLTDSIMIGSIDHFNSKIAMISIPRDMYVDSSIGSFRVNQIFEEARSRWDETQGLDFTRQTLEEILDIPLHYVVKVDFIASEKLIDAVGGIDIYVQSDINDPLYPKDGTYDFEPFYLARGLQHLDGKTALKYARSRKSTSDFDRSRRQQEVIVALKKKALEKGVLRRASRLKDIYYSVSANVATTMSIREMLALADFASNWDSSDFSSATLNDEPLFTGGFLYPPLRSLYGGAYVLIPAGENFDSIRRFTKLILYGPPRIDSFPVLIFNGTSKNGHAGKTRGILNRFGPEIRRVANGRNDTTLATSWYAQSEEAIAMATALSKIIPGVISQEIPPEYSDSFIEFQNAIILELGEDSFDTISKLDIFKNIVELKPATETATETAAEITDEAITTE